MLATSRAWYGMEWKVECNGTEISECSMEDARMEWNGRFQEWNGRHSFVLPYQFYTVDFVNCIDKKKYADISGDK